MRYWGNPFAVFRSIIIDIIICYIIIGLANKIEFKYYNCSLTTNNMSFKKSLTTHLYIFAIVFWDFDPILSYI